VWQIHLYDANAAPGSQLSLVSTSAAGVAQSQGGEGVSTVTAPAISPDGGFVAFRSRGAGLVATDGGGISHVYVKNIATGAIVRASVSSAGVPAMRTVPGPARAIAPRCREGRHRGLSHERDQHRTRDGRLLSQRRRAHPATGRTVGFSSDKTLSGMPAITAGGELIVAYSGFQLDPHMRAAVSSCSPA